MNNQNNSFSDNELRGMITGNNPVSNAYRELLAYREAQGNVVGWKWRLVDVVSGETSAWRVCLLPLQPGGGAGFETESIPLFTAPPLPAVPEKACWEDCPPEVTEDNMEVALAWADGWNACLSIMLNHSERALDMVNSPVIPDCWCHKCRPVTMDDMRFIVCPECGNKRCPRANDHRNACTGSNEPSQEGSAYPAAPKPGVK